MSIQEAIVACSFVLMAMVVLLTMLYYKFRCMHEYEKQGEDKYSAKSGHLGTEDYIVRSYFCKKCGKTKKIRT